MAPLLGSASVQQKGRRANVAPGQWCIYDTTDIYSVDNPSRVEHLIVMLPKEPFVQRGLVLDRLMARPLGGGGSGGCSGGSDPGRGAIARLALQTMRCAHHELPDMNDSTASGVGDTIIQLVALSLLDLAGTATAASQKAQQRDRIKQHVAARLGHPDLSVDSIAAALNCSRRQLYNAFADEPDGVAGYILRQRLLAARKLFDALAVPGSAPRSITEVAFSCGFSIYGSLQPRLPRPCRRGTQRLQTGQRHTRCFQLRSRCQPSQLAKQLWVEGAMSNLTLVVEETTIKAARSRALQEGTSLSAKAREFLAVEGAPKPAAREATLDLMQLMEVVCARLCRTLPRFYEFE